MRRLGRSLLAATALFAAACTTREAKPVAQSHVLPPATIETQWTAGDAPTAIGGGPPTLDESGLDEAQVQATVRARADALRSTCHDPRLGLATVLIQLRIAPNGLVRQARVLDRDGAPEVAECVRRELVRTSFPAGPRETTFPVTLSFR